MNAINQNYVAVVKEMNGHYDVDYVQIKKSDYLLGTLEDIVKNPNKTVFDLEAIFFHHYGFQCDGFPFVTPFAYSSSYVNGGIKPERIDTRNLSSILRNLCPNYDLSDSQCYQMALENLKKLYGKSFERYILQSDLSKALEQVQNNSSVKMYSHDFLGWKHMEFSLSDDVKIYVDTNFGYGYSSYFTLTAAYKDIIITPLSHIVNYYYANVVDLLRCTRDYIVDHDSWEHALKFAAEFANQARNAPEQFVKKYLIHEVEEMMSGLRRIKRDPRAALESMMGRNYPAALSSKTLRIVSDIPKWEIENLKVYGREFPIVFMAEKLTSALDTIEKLEKIAEISPEVTNYLNEIYAMNIDILPLITSTCDNIKREIERISPLISGEEKFIKEKKDELQRLTDEKRVREDAIKPFKEMLKEATIEIKNQEEKDEFLQLFMKENPEYGKLTQNLEDCTSMLNSQKKLIDEHSNTLAKLYDDKLARTALFERLRSCAAKVEQAKNQVA